MFDFLIVIGSIIDVILSEVDVSKSTARIDAVGLKCERGGNCLISGESSPCLLCSHCFHSLWIFHDGEIPGPVVRFPVREGLLIWTHQSGENLLVLPKSLHNLVVWNGKRKRMNPLQVDGSSTVCGCVYICTYYKKSFYASVFLPNWESVFHSFNCHFVRL